MNMLFEPFDLYGLSLANRIVMAPMTRSRAGVDHVPSGIMPEYYRQRASAGLIIAEATAVSLQGCGYPNIPGIWNDTQVAAWKDVTDAVHAVGGRIFSQLFHTGRVAHRSLTGLVPVSSFASAAEGQVMTADYTMQNYETPHMLATAEIPAIVEQFRTAAANAKKAGFDGVEIHGANGYLLDQFLRDGVNRRTDHYGGSIENRARLLLEVTGACIEAFGRRRVGVRLSPYSHFNDMRDSDPVSIFTYAAEKLDALPLAYLHTIEAEETGRPWITAGIRQVFRGVLIANSGLTRESGGRLLEGKAADLVCYGYAYIANPDLVQRFKNNLPLGQADKDTIYGGGEKGYLDYPDTVQTGN